MKKTVLALLVIITFFFVELKAQTTGTFTDARDGRIYKTVKIGKQIWMAENLKYATKGSWIFTRPYDGMDDPKGNFAKYGRLYNWAAAKRACPNGWHLPSKDEWQTLIDYLGGDKVAGSKLKSIRGWESSKTRATNSSGFTAMPGGFRRDEGENGSSFSLDSWIGIWWSATQYDMVNVWVCALKNDSPNAYLSYFQREYMDLQYDTDEGFSVRCLKDN